MVSLTVKFLKFAVAILNLVLSKRIELLSIGYQPIALAIELQEEIWWSLKESNLLPATPLNNGYRVTAGNGGQAPINC